MVEFSNSKKTIWSIHYRAHKCRGLTGSNLIPDRHQAIDSPFFPILALSLIRPDSISICGNSQFVVSISCKKTIISWWTSIIVGHRSRYRTMSRYDKFIISDLWNTNVSLIDELSHVSIASFHVDMQIHNECISWWRLGLSLQPRYHAISWRHAKS